MSERTHRRMRFRSEVGLSPREYRSSTLHTGEHIPFRIPESGELRD
jgi:hypothetical protein